MKLEAPNSVERRLEVFHLCHLHTTTECYYMANFTANKATGFTT